MNGEEWPTWERKHGLIFGMKNQNKMDKDEASDVTWLNCE